MREVILDKGVDSGRIVIVENWPEQSVAEANSNEREFRRQHDLDGKFVVMYSGNMGLFHSFDSILRVALRLRDRDDIAFVFVGQGARKREIVDAARSVGNIYVFDHQPEDKFSDMLASGDVHFVSLRAGYEGLIVPSKFYSILASGRPVIYEGKKKGEVARVIDEESCGVVIEPDSVDLLEKAITNYISSPSLRESHALRARLAYESRFERTVLASRYAHALLDS